MKLLLAFASALATAFGGVVDCGSAPLFSITKLSQSPDTYVRAGDNTSLTLFYKVPEGVSITGGKATTSLSLNGIPFTPSTDNLCTKVTCPISSGEHDGSSWTTFPAGVTGKIVSKVTWTDTTGKELLCIKSTFQASSSDSVTGPINFLQGLENPSFNSLTSSQEEEEEIGKEMIPYFYEYTSSSGSTGNSSASGSSSSGSSSGSGSGSGTSSGSSSGSGSGTGSGSSSGSGSGSRSKKFLRGY